MAKSVSKTTPTILSAAENRAATNKKKLDENVAKDMARLQTQDAAINSCISDGNLPDTAAQATKSINKDSDTAIGLTAKSAGLDVLASEEELAAERRAKIERERQELLTKIANDTMVGSIDVLMKTLNAVQNRIESLGDEIYGILFPNNKQFIPYGDIANVLTNVHELVSNLTNILKPLKPIADSCAGIMVIESVIPAILDLLNSMLINIMEIRDRFTPEQLKALEKASGKFSVESALIKFLQKIWEDLISILKPYITNLLVALAFDCINKMIKILKDAGILTALPPPLSYIPQIIDVARFVTSGQLDVLVNKLYGIGDTIIRDFEMIRVLANNPGIAGMSITEINQELAKRGIDSTHELDPNSELLGEQALIANQQANEKTLQAIHAGKELINAITSTAAAMYQSLPLSTQEKRTQFTTDMGKAMVEANNQERKKLTR